MAQVYRYQGASVMVEVTPNPDGTLRAVVDGRAYTVRAVPRPDGGLLLEIDGQRHLTFAATVGAERQVWADGAVYTLAPGAGSAARAGAGATGGAVLAPMPGVVRAVLAAEGDTVTRGQPIAILEAMKMETRLTAPRDGVLKRLYVSAGAVVERGATVAEVE